MKASLTWMQEYVPVDLTQPAQALADTLTQAGIPVEEVLYMDGGIKKVYTGKITKIVPHPDADKLVVCTLACIGEDGATEEKQIVTGAKNVREGQIVPVAYHKSKLPGDKEIKKGKLRGVMSEGMLCSAAELGIGKDLILPELADGILILPEDTPIGEDIKDTLLLNDIVYEFELTPNRADCFSMVGLSREFAVMTGQKAVLPRVEVKESAESIEGQVNIEITDAELCSRFTARLIKNVTIAPSPLWMQNRLRNCGIRPINNVVDVTNYVMLELGQPMHAYDYDHVKGHTLTARPATEGEILKTLDGSDRTLTSQMLVIADAERAVGVAGVMGGFDSEVTNETRHVLLEAAVFKGSSIRRTARELGMRSEASGRFERGVNPETTVLAMNRATQLLQQICPTCEVVAGLIDVYPVPQVPRTVTVKASEINAYLGTQIEVAEMVRILETLAFAVTAEGEVITAEVPSWRGDVSGMQDIAEEVARIHGYDNIVPSTPWAALTGGTMSPKKALVKEMKHYLASVGLAEMITFSFMHKDSLAKLLIPEGDVRYTAVPILNPISEEFPYMRTTLVPSVVEAAVRNIAQKNKDLWVFEAAAVYEPKAVPVTELPAENQWVCGLMTGAVAAHQWGHEKRTTDFYDVKGIVEGLLRKVGLAELALERAAVPYLHPGVSAAYRVGDLTVATLGEMHPQVAANYELSGKVYLFEINVEAILQLTRQSIRYEGVSKFPGTERDLAIVAPKAVSAGEILALMKAHGGTYLEKVVLFDVYEGEHIEAGYRSLAYNLSFRSAEGTLTDADLEKPLQDILQSLEGLGCRLR